MKPGPRGRRAGGIPEPDPGPVVALLLFEAADCLMALPVSEVTRLLGRPGPGGSLDGEAPPEEWVDLDKYFTGGRSEGPWLRWGRRDRSTWLRVARVVEVMPYAVLALARMPAPARATPRAGAFWAAGIRGDDVFLLVDPARLTDPREG